MNKKKKLVIPKFHTEAEEADWWFAHRKELMGEFERASKAGTLQVMTPEKLEERIEASKARAITIRLADTDIALAREQAARRGLPYQTYIKSLLHQALEAAKSA